MNANTKSLIAAAALAIVATSASAFETFGQQYAGPSTQSRAEVVAELARARKAGEITQTAEAYSQVDAALQASRNSAVSRAQVRRELAQAQDSQDYVAANEAYGSVAAGTAAAARRGAAE